MIKDTKHVKVMMKLLEYYDGKNDLIEVAELINKPVCVLFEIVDQLKVHKLVQIVDF